MTLLVAIAAVVAVLVYQVYPVVTEVVTGVVTEGFQTQTPMEKAKKLLSYMDFEGTGDSMILRVNTPGGIRVENGGVTITNVDDDTTFAGKAGGVLFNQADITKPLMSLPKGAESVATTWSLMPDKNGVLSASVTDWNPVANDGGYVPIVGLTRSQTDGSYVVPSM